MTTARQIKKARDVLARSPGGRDEIASALQERDRARFYELRSTPNGSAELVAFHDAVLDADDTLESIDRAIAAGHMDEARQLIALGRESLRAHLTELKGML